MVCHAPAGLGNNESERVKTAARPTGPHFEERSMNSEALWAQGAQHSNRYLETAGPKRCNPFQNLDLVAPGKVPAVQLFPPSCRPCKSSTSREAQALWSQSLQGTPEVKDRRFSGDGWAPTRGCFFQRPPTCSTPAR